MNSLEIPLRDAFYSANADQNESWDAGQSGQVNALLIRDILKRCNFRVSSCLAVEVVVNHLFEIHIYSIRCIEILLWLTPLIVIGRKRCTTDVLTEHRIGTSSGS
jgi:hypothetical protein